MRPYFFWESGLGRLDGKVAIVTGGTRGIGALIVERYCSEGASVAFTGRDKLAGGKVAEKTGAVFVEADALDPDSDAVVLSTAIKHFGRLDVLVNNAGSPGLKGGVAHPECLQEAIDIHLLAPWRLTARVVPEMKRFGEGSIINMCSVAGQRVGAISMGYSVAKAGLLHWTRCAAAELGSFNIRVNSISPGFIETAIHASAFGIDISRGQGLLAKLGQMFAARQAIRQVGQPDDVAGAAVFLASSEARFITGADIVVDGGLMWGQS